jgi:hypothetical protein
MTLIEIRPHHRGFTLENEPEQASPNSEVYPYQRREDVDCHTPLPPRTRNGQRKCRKKRGDRVPIERLA